MFRARRGFRGQGAQRPSENEMFIVLHFLGLAFYRSLQSLIKRGFVLLVFFLRDLALLAFNFQLKEFFLEGF
jgi:hypothetical protein